MALGDYILCNKCECKLLYDGDRSNRDWWVERFGKDPEIYCPDCENQKEWQGLTVDEILDLLPSSEWKADVTLIFAKAVEAKLKEKNT